MSSRSQQSLQQGYDKVASRYDARMGPATLRRIDRIDSFIASFVPGAGRALELGCGTGRLLARIDAEVPVGVDLSQEMCKRARLRQLTAIQADQGRLPIGAAFADAVVSGYASTRHTPHSILLPELARILVDGGRFALHVFPESRLSLRAFGLGQPIGPAAERQTHDLPARLQANALFAKHGLRITEVFALRNAPEPLGYVVLPPGTPLSWATHVVVAGIREIRSTLRVPVAGGSMRPTLEIGDVVTVMPTRDLLPGDIALFRPRGAKAMVCHRVIQTAHSPSGHICIHRGDSPGGRLRIARDDETIGKVVSASRGARDLPLHPPSELVTVGAKVRALFHAVRWAARPHGGRRGR